MRCWRRCARATKKPIPNLSPPASYAKETIDLPGGETVRDYPRLKHGGAHLGEREGDVVADAGFTAFRVGVLALLGWLALAESLPQRQSSAAMIASMEATPQGASSGARP